MHYQQLHVRCATQLRQMYECVPGALIAAWLDASQRN